MFLGTHPLRLDDKGRLFLPVKWRAELSEGLVITKGQESCLYVFGLKDFVAMGDRLREAPVTAGDLRNYSRIFFGSASDQTPDKVGRLTVPPDLRSYAGVEREVVLVGVSSRAEIWDSATWEAYVNEKEPAFTSMSEEVLPGVL